MLLEYLSDAADAIGKGHLDRWLAGDDQNEAEARGRALQLTEIATLEFGHIVNFYQDEASTEEDQDDNDGHASASSDA